MKKVFFCLSILVILCWSLSFSLDFKYNQKEGRKYRFKNQVVFDVYENNRFIERQDSMNKAVLELISVSNGLGDYHGKYYNYNRDKKTDETYKLTAVYDNHFLQDERGRMTVSPNDIIPSTRSIPAFPDKTVEIGESWKAAGEEIFENACQHCSPKQVEVFYRKANLIFQDCECVGVDTVKKEYSYGSGVHAVKAFYPDCFL